MRNPLKRLVHPDQLKRPLRERVAAAKGRLVAVKEKYGQTLRVHRALNAPAVVPEPVDRVALVNYATFLALERHRVCAELYPHMGTKATQFVLSLNAAWAFFSEGRSSTNDRKDLPSASSRAVKVLDTVGIDWRSDRTDSARHFFDEADRRDTGERPAVPYGWPALDAELTEALDDLTRLDAAIDGLYSGVEGRDADTVPGYEALEEARRAAIGRLAITRASSLPGLQAKAHAILTSGVEADYDATGDLATSLARDLTGAGRTWLDEHRPDRIFAVIEDAKRLEAEADALEAALPKDQDVPNEWGRAVLDHIRNKLLKTRPTTAAGCAALAAFVLDFFDRWGSQISHDDAAAVLGLIARSPMRH